MPFLEKKIMKWIIIALLLVACTDYVEQIDGQIEEYNVCARAREESSIRTADYFVDPDSVVKGTYRDERDGKVYKIVTIGSQTWMAENLNYEVEGSYCNEDNPVYCDKYGRFYTWAAAMDSAGKFSSNGEGCGNGKICAPTYPVRGVCPKGWHFPSSGEWGTLLSALGRYYYCDSKKNGECLFNTENAYGFSVLYAGARMEGKYYSAGTFACFWLSTENSKIRANVITVYPNNGIGPNGADQKDFGFSVRCVKD